MLRSFALLALIALGAFEAVGQDKLAPSLYERVGRYDGISAIAGGNYGAG